MWWHANLEKSLLQHMLSLIVCTVYALYNIMTLCKWIHKQSMPMWNPYRIPCYMAKAVWGDFVSINLHTRREQFFQFLFWIVKWTISLFKVINKKFRENTVPWSFSIEQIDLEISSLHRILLDGGDSLLPIGVIEWDLDKVVVADIFDWRCSNFSKRVSFSKTEPVLLKSPVLSPPDTPIELLAVLVNVHIWYEKKWLYF